LQGQRDIVRFLSDCEEIWHRRFPGLHRRAQWHIANYLCTKGRTGAAVGELTGVVKQVFLLDDATVRERVTDMVGLAFCTLDPPDATISARTVVVPTETLLSQFDSYLLEIAAALLVAAAALEPGTRRADLRQVDDDSRQIVLQAVESCRNHAINALERGFEEAGLSRARRLDARRHLLSASHWGLLLSALGHRYGVPGKSSDQEGVLADEMAAALLALIRQNFQTTRDHIAYLMQLGILERRQGRALRVALADAAGLEFDRAFAEAAADLPRIVRKLSELERDLELTAINRSAPGPGDHTDTHILLVRGPGEPDRVVPIGSEPLVIGRAPGSGVHLSAIEVSRAHCRVRLSDGRVTVTDLRSTNGTLINGRPIASTITLAPASVFQVGPYRIEYQKRGVVDPDATVRSAELAGAITPLRHRRRSPG
jgi:hypothetical protein